MSLNESVPCRECGEQTLAARPVCNLCAADEGLCAPRTNNTMLLLTYKEWLGKSSSGVAALQCQGIDPGEPEISTVAFATMLPLGAAILLVKGHSDAYKHKYPSMAVEFTLLSVSKIEVLTREELKAAAIELIEELPQSVEAFN